METYKPNYDNDCKCHFCKKSKSEVGLELNVHLEDIFKSEYVISVPRCHKCRNRHKKTTSISVFGIISAILINIMLIGGALTISVITAILAAIFGFGVGYGTYYLCQSIEEIIVNGGDNEANGIASLDELKMLCDSVIVNDKHNKTEDDVFYRPKNFAREKLNDLVTKYNYVEN